MPSGYYIYNPKVEKISYDINDNTVYKFIDWGNNFVGEDEDKRYSTTDKDEFAEYLNTYSDNAAKIPFWITVKDGVIQIIQEQLVP